MISIEEKRNQTLGVLKSLGNRDARYRYVIEIGKKSPSMPAHLRVETNIVEGCLAQTWFAASLEDKRYHFAMDSEAVIIRGIMAILLPVYQGRTAAEISTVHPGFLSEAGILDTISTSRRSGLANICRKIIAIGGSH